MKLDYMKGASSTFWIDKKHKNLFRNPDNIFEMAAKAIPYEKVIVKRALKN
jgi:hypothetical protein